jgi:hypothetical protein
LQVESAQPLKVRRSTRAGNSLWASVAKSVGTRG